ncbi:MAG: DUF4242 domain-containing protein [Bacteroidetes bacterium]|nr:DUF4242 domain-containing protein [Bacteroidota bacterium]MBS1744632.1 DUF4242 domain-containing protein [Bacteroidota bacterium]
MKAITIMMPLLISTLFSVTSVAQSNNKTIGNVFTKNLYIDVHHLGQGNITAGAVAAAHQKDLSTQRKYRVQFIKYWVDTVKGDVYCLSSAADSNSITKTHSEAHGLIPDEVFSVMEGTEASMLGGKNLYLDIHDLGPGNVTTEAVVSAHKKDLSVQKKYHVNFINYWVDEKKGKVFCLSEANKSTDVIQTHKEAHGLLPNNILKVKQGQ